MSKYGNRKCKINGHCFDSVAERDRYLLLDALRKFGDISELELQPKFMLQEGFTQHNIKHRPITYIADFKYIDTATNQTIVEDVKGVATKEYLIKKKLFLNLHGKNIVFREVRLKQKKWEIKES